MVRPITLRAGSTTISNLMELTYGEDNMGNVESFEKLLLEEPKREQLFPLFEEVFGIPSQTLHDFSERGYWDDTYKALSFYKKIKRLQTLRYSRYHC